MAGNTVLSERLEDGVHLITLNRPCASPALAATAADRLLCAVLLGTSESKPSAVCTNRERMNSWSGELADEFFYALNECDGDPDCRVIVVTGEGRAFCAGADAQGRFDPNAETPEQREMRKKRDASKATWTIKRFHDISLKLRQPLICAINGGCVGIGLSLAMACDMRFASNDAKIGVIFPQRGLIAEDVSTRAPRCTVSAPQPTPRFRHALPAVNLNVLRVVVVLLLRRGWDTTCRT
jgi:enoyl-CoA hydratase/carnithine racemase